MADLTSFGDSTSETASDSRENNEKRQAVQTDGRSRDFISKNNKGTGSTRSGTDIDELSMIGSDTPSGGNTFFFNFTLLITYFSVF